MDFVLPLVVLVLDLWALMEVFGSSADGRAKLLWTLFIVLVPGIGLLCWFILGPKKMKRVEP